MNNPDQDILIRAIEDARLILGEYIAPGPRRAKRTVQRLITILDRSDVVHALERVMRRKVTRLVELERKNPPREGFSRDAAGAHLTRNRQRFPRKIKL